MLMSSAKAALAVSERFNAYVQFARQTPVMLGT